MSMTKKPKPEPLRGEKLLKTVVNQILQHPETWDQKTWHTCQTVHCVGGWCQLLAGLPQDADTARTDAKKVLEISEGEANYLFSSERSLAEIWQFAQNFGGDYRAGYDRAGYNRAGYDRAGYNRDGYDRAGYDRDGYNRDGYNRDGYDRDGYDCDGKRLPLFSL